MTENLTPNEVRSFLEELRHAQGEGGFLLARGRSIDNLLALPNSRKALDNVLSLGGRTDTHVHRLLEK